MEKIKGNNEENNLEDMEEQDKRDVRKEGSDSGKMGNAPIGKLLLDMSWPAILSMTIGALYNIVDSIFVAMISKEALTAVSFVMPLQMLMISVAVGSAVGVNSLIARRLGAKRLEEANKAASTSIRIGAFNWIVFALIGFFTAGPFMASYTSDAVIYQYGVTYLRIVTMVSLFSMVELQLEKVLQATGNMIAPMIISLSGAVTNIILDPILIFGLLGMPRMEVAGAAAATVIGQGVSLIVAVFLFFRKEHDVAIQIRGFHVDWAVVKDIYAVGLPGMIMQSIGSIMLFGYNAILASSATAVAVLGVYFELQSFVFMPVFGLGQGSMPIMGYNYGARNRKRLMEVFKKAMIAAVTIMAVGTIIFQIAPEQLLKLFSADEEMIKVGVPALRIISICFLPAAYGITCSTMFQSTGHGMYSMFASILRQLACILPLAYILYHEFGLTVSWASFPLAEITGTIYATVMIIHLYKKELRNMQL